MDRLQLSIESKERVRKLEFGQPVTNVCAAHPSRRHSYFVEYVVKASKSRGGVMHRQHFAKCTDRKGNFWNTGIEVIFAGHLSDDKCKQLFDPIHKALYGSL